MAGRRTDLELVITTRNQTQEGLQQAEANLKQFSQRVEAVSQALAAVGAGAAFAGLVKGVDRATEAFNRLRNATIGAETVASRMGESVSEVNALIDELTADGLMGFADAATSVKNLLASGFNLEQTRNLILAFKDAAAFGRQSALSFGEAVRSATEGIKNGNSILVDNAGITKNLSVILEEAGYNAQDLQRATTDASVRMALYNGILREAAVFQGDAAKLAGELSGAQARSALEAEKLAAALGETLAPAVAIVHEKGGEWLQTIRKWIEVNPEAARALTLFAAGVVGATSAMTVAVGVVNVLRTAVTGLMASFGPVGLAIAGVTALAGALGGLILADQAQAREQRALQNQTADLMREYEALRRILDDATVSTEKKQLASQRLKDVLAKLFELQPQMRNWFDEEGRLLDTATEKWNRYRDAVIKAKKVELTQSIQDTERELNQKREELAKKSTEFWKEIDRAVMRERIVSGPEAAAKLEKELHDRFEDVFALQTAALERDIASLEARLERDKALLAALDEPLPEEKVLPPPPPVSSGGGGATRQMSPALQAALEDLEDLRAMENTPENLQKQLAKVREILDRHGAELEKLGRKRDLERMRDIILPRQIAEAIEQATGAEFRQALEQLNADIQLQELQPETIRERLEAIKQQFADYLKAHPDQALQLELRLKGAREDELRAPLERWQQRMRENEQLGLYEIPGGLSIKLQHLREGLGLALAAGDQTAYFDIVGQIRQVEQALQQADFEGKFNRIKKAREQAFTDAAEDLARMERELIDAEAAGDTQLAAEIKQRMLDAVRPALEEQKRALEELLQDETLTAAQREQVEAELNRVKQELYDQDTQAHRIATEAKVAAEREAAQKRAEAERQVATAISNLRTVLRRQQDQDLAAMERIYQAEEEAQQRRIDRLREELEALERRNREEDRALKLADLRRQLQQAEEAGPLEEFITAEGQRIWRNRQAEELREQIAEEERQQERERERERLQEQIEQEQERLNAMRQSHQQAMQERRQFWSDLLALDDEELAELVSQTETSLGPDGWYGTMENWLSQAAKLTTEKVNSITSDLARVVDKVREAQRALESLTASGSIDVPEPTSIPSTSSPGVSVGGIKVDVNVHGTSDPAATAQAVAQAVPSAIQEGFDLAQARAGARWGLRIV